MIHDPEFNIQIERQLDEIIKRTEDVKKHLSKNDTIFAFLGGMDFLLSIAVDLRKDYNECLDERKKDLIKIEFKKIMTSIKEGNDILLRLSK